MPIDRDIGHVAIKESVFPFARFPGTDPVLSPEMKSTGEVMGISDNFDIAFAKSQLGGGIVLPDAGTVFISVKDSDKAAHPRRGEADGRAWLRARSRPAGPRDFLERARACRSRRSTRWRRGGRTSSTGSSTAGCRLVFNTTEGWQSLKDSQAIREAALKAQGALLHHGGGEPGRGATRSGRCAGTRLKFARSNPIIRLRNTDFSTKSPDVTLAPPLAGAAGRFWQEGM